MTQNLNKSVLFKAYNEVKAGIVATAPTQELKVLLAQRANRALGQIQSGIAEHKLHIYDTGFYQCDCPDRHYRDVICKHNIERSILEKYRRSAQS